MKDSSGRRRLGRDPHEDDPYLPQYLTEAWEGFRKSISLFKLAIDADVLEESRHQYILVSSRSGE